jgi:hypothetical protein
LFNCAILDGFLFKEVAIKMNPNSEIPDLFPKSYRICGTVVSDKSQTVTFSQVGQTKIVTTVSDMNSGRFCEFLSPGKYHVQVVVDIADSKKGLQYALQNHLCNFFYPLVSRFFPKVQSIEVESEQSGTIIFSQLKATIQGRVRCLTKNDCVGLKAILRPSGETAEKNEVTINISGRVAWRCRRFSTLHFVFQTIRSRFPIYILEFMKSR